MVARSIENRLRSIEQTRLSRRVFVACSREAEAEILAAEPGAQIVRVNTGVPRLGNTPFGEQARSGDGLSID
ncbi:hypothetical protein GCM10007874_17710 [Labrys miyagiensis]|uniref:Uncharacterized protein n=1 Tax=Labrys miyagiensis TaxID=346912 RepID=A0ABQ6CG38_9HYPH|nr:hypothetical protein GCM10007874_17710 [Labrys miyagiensis]